MAAAHPVNPSEVITANRPLRCRHPGASSWRFIGIRRPKPDMIAWARPPCQRLGRHRTSSATGHCAAAILARSHGASSPIRPTPSEASLLWTRPPGQPLGGRIGRITERDRQLPTGHCVDCHHGTSYSSTLLTPNGALSRERDNPANSSDPIVPSIRPQHSRIHLLGSWRAYGSSARQSGKR